MHLLRNVYFFSGLHLWDSNNLIPWNTVVLLDWLHRHGVSVSILGGLVGLELVVLLLHIMVLGWAIKSLWNLNILRSHILDFFSILFQKLSWCNVLSHYQASIGTTRSTFSSIEMVRPHFFNWIILLNLILLENLRPILIWILFILAKNWKIIAIKLLLIVVLKLLWKL